VPTWRGVA